MGDATHQGEDTEIHMRKARGIGEKEASSQVKSLFSFISLGRERVLLPNVNYRFRYHSTANRRFSTASSPILE